MPDTGGDDGTSIWHAPDGVHLDLRGLAPPEPMVAVLRMIDHGDVERVLIADFDREPIFLYPELDDRGWSHTIIASDYGCGAGVVRLRIARERE